MRAHHISCPFPKGSESTIEIDGIDPRSSIELEGISEFYISPFIPSGVEANITLIITTYYGVVSETTTSIILGQPEVVVQYDFESSDGLELWNLSGDSNWYTTSDHSNSGLNSFRSGAIGDSQQSTASIVQDLLV